jgi:hypothetical protein
MQSRIRLTGHDVAKLHNLEVVILGKDRHRFGSLADYDKAEGMITG